MNYILKNSKQNNGITQRRWLKKNPELSAYLDHLVGNEWVTDLYKLEIRRSL